MRHKSKQKIPICGLSSFEAIFSEQSDLESVAVLEAIGTKQLGSQTRRGLAVLRLNIWGRHFRDFSLDSQQADSIQGKETLSRSAYLHRGEFTEIISDKQVFRTSVMLQAPFVKSNMLKVDLV